MAVLAAAVLFPLVAFSAAMTLAFDRHEHREAEHLIQQASQSAVAVAQSYVARQGAFLEGLSTAYDAVDDAKARPSTAQLTRVLARHPDWLGVAALDPAGVPLAEAGALRHDAIQAAANDAGGLDAVRLPDPASPEPYFFKDLVVHDGDRVAYRLVAAIRAWPVTLELQRDLPPGLLVCVIDAKGNVVSLTRLKQPLGGIIGAAPTDSVLAGLALPRGTLFEATMKGGDQVYALAAGVPDTGWTLVVGVPQAIFDANQRQAILALVIGSLIAAGLALVLLRGMVRSWADRDRLQFQLGIEQERDDAERRLSDIAENFPGVIYRRVQKPDGSVEHPYISAGGARLFSLAPGQTLSPRQLAAQLFPEDRAGWLAAWEHSAQSGEPFAFEGRIIGPDNAPRWLRCAANLHRDGADLVWDGVMTDVTSQKATEDLIRHAKESAEKASAAKTKFLATASHDLRQPIQSLLLFAMALKTKLRGHESARVVDKMNAALETLKSMLDNLLDLSKIEAKMVEPELRTFEITGLVRQLFDTFEPRFAKAGLRFRCVSCSAWVRADPALLAQILGNLLDNALKYTPKGGVLLGCRRSGETVRIQVIDTGVGIATDDLDTIFDEFVQVGEAGRERRQGLGLGLATVRALCRLIDCRLTVTSKPGKGSIFSVELPTTAPALATLDLQDAESAPPRRILVIDDEDFILDGMRAVLEDAGHQVMAAGSLAEAGRVIEQHGPPDLVLADYRLGPGATGIQVIEELRAKIGPVPAAIITGDTEVAKLVPGGAKVTVLHKPLAGGELQRVVQRLARRRS